MELIAKLLLLVLLTPHMMGARAAPGTNTLTQTTHIGETEKNNETKYHKN